MSDQQLYPSIFLHKYQTDVILKVYIFKKFKAKSKFIKTDNLPQKEHPMSILPIKTIFHLTYYFNYPAFLYGQTFEIGEP